MPAGPVQHAFQYTGAPEERLDPVAYPVALRADDIAVQCVVPGVPLSKQRPRFVRKTGAVFTPRETRDREQTIGAYAQLNAGWAKPDAVSAFGVRVVFYVANAQRKDTDNMLKLVLDGLTKIIWADDSQVGEVMAWKREDHAQPRTEFVAYRLGYPAARTGKLCVRCGTSFVVYPSLSKTCCSTACAAELRRVQRVPRRPCLQCGVLVYRRAKEGRVFCSVRCKSLGDTIECTCAQCGIKYRKPQSQVRAGRTYCSDTCLRSFRNAGRRSQFKGICIACGGGVTRKEYLRCAGCRQNPGNRTGNSGRTKKANRLARVEQAA
jgi:Holliday junction resolvase RusA-like endonuclease/endogenous inhibitor of DNA gyrase (YacG/DUF329 family)